MSAIRQLLDELSWEGDARTYRDGGLGVENVLTAEVFQALDFLPRQAFLGRVLRGASGRVLDVSEDEVEAARVDVLPGDLRHGELPVRAQPDVVVESESTFVFVEAKRMSRGTFGPDQITKEAVMTVRAAQGRIPVLLLVLGAPPPVPVRGYGRLSITNALALGAELMTARHGRCDLPEDAEDMVAWTTWHDIRDRVREAVSDLDVGDASSRRSVLRLAESLISAVAVHDV